MSPPISFMTHFRGKKVIYPKKKNIENMQELHGPNFLFKEILIKNSHNLSHLKAFKLCRWQALKKMYVRIIIIIIFIYLADCNSSILQHQIIFLNSPKVSGITTKDSPRKNSKRAILCISFVLGI